MFASGILYALMDLRAKSDVVHGFALGSSVSTGHKDVAPALICCHGPKSDVVHGFTLGSSVSAYD